ncbi:VWA domain-containing protein [Tumidithrix elongata RA019]|uniref:VWA domain-containing protein n=1 Tax=Tumidithrix elongata BACA0141 TaxID=2716417 RepID=A0AAW9PV06_9CYAN|nr:VWA domain-containing protein [Tumidithrix elongata RA019]
MSDRADSPKSNPKNLMRWRHILGRFAQDKLQCPMEGRDARIEAALDYLYGREYQGRGMRGKEGKGNSTEKQPGSLDPSQLNVPSWIAEVRELFPKETVEIVEKHALDRYGMTELVTDPQVLEKLEPNISLLKTILTFRGMMQGEVLQVARRIVREVVEEIKQRLASEVRQVLVGKLNRAQHSPLKVAQNLDWRGTIRQNLKHYDPERQRLIIQNVRFFARTERRVPWQVILCIDQSGSMADSVIHSAVMAGILAGLPLLRVSLVVFDTAVVDLSEYVDDPVEILMSVQLGGGTDIGQAIAYCEGLIENPNRTVLILVSDFAEGASPMKLLSACRRLKESSVTLLGLASLDESANPYYDRQMAERLAETGMEIAALTPKRLAEWLAKVIS